MYSLLLDGYNADDVKSIATNPFRKSESDSITLRNGYTVKTSELEDLFSDRSLNLCLSYYHKFKVFTLGKSFMDVSAKVVDVITLLESLYNAYTMERMK